MAFLKILFYISIFLFFNGCNSDSLSTSDCDCKEDEICIVGQCFSNELCFELECNEWEICDIANGECILKEGYCYNDFDCKDSYCINNICTTDRDFSCDDQLPISCKMDEPDCSEGEILSHQNGCYLCVNPDNCKPWGMAECEMDNDCLNDQYCYECALSSCSNCTDCIAGCIFHNCETEDNLICDMERIDCGEYRTAIIKDGCWVCIDSVTCKECSQSRDCLSNPWNLRGEGHWFCENEICVEIVGDQICGDGVCSEEDGENIENCSTDCERDKSCDDGTEPLCDLVEPTCLENEILAYQNSCYSCVNPASCKPWGVSNCELDNDCLPTEYCNGCGTSSCPGCDDCIAICVEHSCISEFVLICDQDRPECDAGEVAIILDGCWKCVNSENCQ